jgi:hypothetical protein
MKKYLLPVFALVLCFVLSCSKKRNGKPRVLVFTKTAGFVHSSIPTGIAAINKLAVENGFETDTTSNASLFNEDSLSNYAAVVFLSTTGDVLNNKQEIAFERYIQAGGGLWVCMQLQIQNMIGAGMEDWWALTLADIQNHKQPGLLLRTKIFLQQVFLRIVFGSTLMSFIISKK